MKEKELKGIGGFLLVYILIYIISIIFIFFGIKQFRDVTMYYMPWNEKIINFVYYFSILMAIVSTIHVMILIFIREKFVISFTIYFYLLSIISHIFFMIVFKDIFYINSNNAFQVVLIFIVQIIIILYFKNSKRVQNTYNSNESYSYNKKQENNTHSNKEENYNSTSYKNFDNEYKNWNDFEKNNSSHTTNNDNKNNEDNKKEHQYKEFKREQNDKNTNQDEKFFSKDVDNSFKLFEMDTTSSFEEIKNKYRLLIKIYHPDKNNSDEETARYAEQKTKEINIAFNILKDFFTKKY